nr:hypothetical protein [Paenibacillus xylaniclasticus]
MRNVWERQHGDSRAWTIWRNKYGSKSGRSSMLACPIRTMIGEASGAARLVTVSGSQFVAVEDDVGDEFLNLRSQYFKDSFERLLAAHHADMVRPLAL